MTIETEWRNKNLVAFMLVLEQKIFFNPLQEKQLKHMSRITNYYIFKNTFKKTSQSNTIPPKTKRNNGLFFKFIIKAYCLLSVVDIIIIIAVCIHDRKNQ